MRPRLSFAGCDYLGLAKHPSVLGALRKSVDPEITKEARVSISASRFTTGNHPLYRDLERALSRYFGRPHAFLMPSGYTAVIAAIQGIAHKFSKIIFDEGCHSSTIDALRFVDPCKVPFQHLSVADVQRIVKKSPPDSRLLLITDGLFGTNGDIAPIADYLRVLPKTSMLLIDDAHGAGVLGASGRGTAEYWGASCSRIIQTISLSKAFGTFGGAILGENEDLREIGPKSSIARGSTPVPIPICACAIEAVFLVGRAKNLRRKLHANVRIIKNHLNNIGFSVAETPSPVIAIHPDQVKNVEGLKRALQRKGIQPGFICYPTVSTGFFRFAISANHSSDDMALLGSVLERHILGKGSVCRRKRP